MLGYCFSHASAKLVSISDRVSTDGAKKNIFFVMLVLVRTLALCSAVYEIVA